ncbi:predicted protein [Botrytis cinerea T4]|uniref:Uncharacterized protein n=1 Tax=Botryotinia fuckeliana (strain T4) TaxID=999810 RepID=G2YXA6_BOTF4|nr:predicted protein [Botrytis cinerea T4]
MGGIKGLAFRSPQVTAHLVTSQRVEVNQIYHTDPVGPVGHLEIGSN